MTNVEIWTYSGLIIFFAGIVLAMLFVKPGNNQNDEIDEREGLILFCAIGIVVCLGILLSK